MDDCVAILPQKVIAVTFFAYVLPNNCLLSEISATMLFHINMEQMSKRSGNLIFYLQRQHGLTVRLTTHQRRLPDDQFRRQHHLVRFLAFAIKLVEQRMDELIRNGFYRLGYRGNRGSEQLEKGMVIV